MEVVMGCWGCKEGNIRFRDSEDFRVQDRCMEVSNLKESALVFRDVF